MPDLRTQEWKRKGVWASRDLEGQTHIELSFQLCSDSSLGGLGKVLKGLFTEQGEEEPGGGDETSLSIHQSMKQLCIF